MLSIRKWKAPGASVTDKSYKGRENRLLGVNLSKSCLGWTGENYGAYKHLGMVEAEATTPKL